MLRYLLAFHIKLKEIHVEMKNVINSFIKNVMVAKEITERMLQYYMHQCVYVHFTVKSL